MNDNLDDAIRQSIEDDFEGGAVVSSWVLVTSVEQADGSTAYVMLTTPGMRRHEYMGLLAVGKDDLL